MSGWTDAAYISEGMVSWKLSIALCPCRSLYIWSPSDSVARIPLNRHRRTLSCLQVCLPCSNAVGYPFKIWNAVGSFDEHKLYLESSFCFHASGSRE